jgi:hypothetical protein
MRAAWLAVLAPLALVACGGDERPVVVTTPPAQVITVPQGQAQQPVVVVPERR